MSPYGILMVNTIFFPAIFGLLLVFYAAFRRDWGVLLLSDNASQRSLWMRGSEAQTLALTGLFNALNGIFIVYASPPSRTPPLIQAVLQNAGVIFSVPFSIWWLGDKKAYCSRYPLLAALLVALSVVVSILPTILEGNAGDDLNGASSAAWCFIYIAGLIPAAAYNVLQQRYLIQSGALEVSASVSKIVKASLRMLFYSCLWMLVFMVLLFWTDLLPWFGSSSPAAAAAAGEAAGAASPISQLSYFIQQTTFSIACSFGGGGAVGDGSAYPDLGLPTSGACGTLIPVYAYGFVFSYTISYLSGAALNRESSTYTMLSFVLVTLMTSAVWYIPGTNPNPQNTPVWSVATSIALSLAGIFLWKRWELSELASHEQFLLMASPPDAIGSKGLAAPTLPGDDESGEFLLGIASINAVESQHHTSIVRHLSVEKNTLGANSAAGLLWKEGRGGQGQRR